MAKDSLTQKQRDRAIEWLQDIFENDVTKLLLSSLIIISLLPFPGIEVFSLVFFALFAIELTLRILVLRYELRNRSPNWTEIFMLVLDIFATLSFLPLETIFGPVKFLRLLRLTRMLLLLSYWSSIGHEIWIIITKKERRYQLVFVASVVVILTFVSTILMFHFESLGVDFNDDGIMDAKRPSFGTLFWWSFRQLQDPGNLVKNPASSLAFACSFFLTMAGIFVVTFLIGIGTSVVEELVAMGRQHRLGIRGHSVIANLSQHNKTLVEELVNYYAKSFRSPRIVTMGESDGRYNYLYQDNLRQIRYRQGKSISTHDLLRVDTDRAKRVILLGKPSQDNSDAEIISQILSVRQVNADCWIYAELFRSDNITAAHQAGKIHTVPILAQDFTALLLADIVLFPGINRIYSELLTSRGNEIYSCLYGVGELSDQAPPSAMLLPFDEMLKRSHQAHGVILLGYVLNGNNQDEHFQYAINPKAQNNNDIQNHPSIPQVDKLRGFFGVAQNFRQIREMVRSLPDISASLSSNETPQIPKIKIFPTTCDAKKILVCGFHEGIVDFCKHMALFAKDLRITILVPQNENVSRLESEFLSHSQHENFSESKIRFVHKNTGNLDFFINDNQSKQGSIRIFASDWSNERILVNQDMIEHRLSDTEVVVLCPTITEQDPDAKTALALLKLLTIKQNDPDKVHPNLRIICEVLDSEKANLLENRFGGINNNSITFVAREKMRNAFLAQSIFVPGIAQIYDELLKEKNSEICRISFCGDYDSTVILTFGQLLSALYKRDGIIVIGLELDDEEEGTRLIINPNPRSDDYTFCLGHVRSIYAVGNSQILINNGGLNG